MESNYDSHTSYSSSFSSSSSSYSRDSHYKPRPSYIASLHSVRKPPTLLLPKPMLKKPIAPLPPNPPKVYKVDYSHFKQVVQKLTSVPVFQNSASRRRLQDVAPPPLNISSAPHKILLTSLSFNTSTTTTAAASTNEMMASDAPPSAATLQSFPSPLPAIFRDLMDDNLFDPIPSKGFGSEQLISSTSPVLGFSLTPNFSSFLNETLDNSGKDDDEDMPTKSSELSWGLIPLGFNTKETSTTASKLSDCFGSLSPLGTFNMSPTISKSSNTTKVTKLSSDDCLGSLMSPLGFGLSPSSAAWRSLALASPGADHLLVSPMGQTTVL